MTARTEEEWYAARHQLYQLRQAHPDWHNYQYAEATHMSISWVKRWKAILLNQPATSPTDPADPATPADDASASVSASDALDKLLRGKSCAPHTKPPPLHPLIVERILHYRQHLLTQLHRVPGPKTLHYYLTHDPQLVEQGLTVPSTTTIWKLLVRYGCIARPAPKGNHPLPRADPLQHWQCDFKDCSVQSIDPDGKKQHFIEVFDIVDSGTSILIDAIARTDYNASTVIASLPLILQQWGLPRSLTFDRDTRLVGSYAGRDFPAAFVKFLHCVGIEPRICPPHRPDLNAFVERYHRSYKYECLAVHHPQNCQQVQEVTTHYQSFYNYERPHQGASCNNQPPRKAFPDAVLPTLPGLPLLINPDSWLWRVNHHRFVRRVNSRGTVSVDKREYYIGPAYAKQYVSLEVDAATQALVVWQKQTVIKTVGIKGLHHSELSLADYVTLMQQEAISDYRRAQGLASVPA